LLAFNETESDNEQATIDIQHNIIKAAATTIRNNNNNTSARDINI